MPSKTNAYVALLRGVNLGKRKVPMPELAKLYEDTGATDVRTFINSGNVVFRAPAPLAKKLPDEMAKRLEKKFGFEVPVVQRSADELAQAVKANPFVKRGVDEDALHLYFLAHQPSADAVRALDPQRSPGDSFEVVGAHVYLHLPNGVADTKLTNAWLDSKLETICTGRNWRTVLKLLELTSS